MLAKTLLKADKMKLLRKIRDGCDSNVSCCHYWFSILSISIFELEEKRVGLRPTLGERRGKREGQRTP